MDYSRPSNTVLNIDLLRISVDTKEEKSYLINPIS